jgi:hypothetical protein
MRVVMGCMGAPAGCEVIPFRWNGATRGFGVGTGQVRVGLGLAVSFS